MFDSVGCQTAGHATDGNIIRRKRITCWVTRATDIHSEYVILMAFPGQHLLRYCVSKLRYKYSTLPVLLNIKLGYFFIAVYFTTLSVSHCQYLTAFQSQKTMWKLAYCAVQRCVIRDRALFCLKVPRLWPLVLLVTAVKGDDKHGALVQRCWHEKDYG